MLVVEDDQNLAAGICAGLAEVAFTVDTAHDGGDGEVLDASESDLSGATKLTSREGDPDVFPWSIPTALPVPVVTIGLLILSNICMTFAWYGHLKFKAAPLLTVILISWAIAFLEYCFHVPANRIGHGYFSAAQLKTMQEVITLIVFAVFSVWYLGEPVRWNHLAGFAMIAGGAALVFLQR